MKINEKIAQIWPFLRNLKFCYEPILKKFPIMYLLYVSHSLNCVKDRAHLDASKFQWSLNSFFLQKNLNFNFVSISTSKSCKIMFSILSSTTMPIFIIFFIKNWVKKERKKSIKNVKTAWKTNKGGKTQMILVVGGVWIFGFIVEEEKLDFSNQQPTKH